MCVFAHFTCDFAHCSCRYFSYLCRREINAGTMKKGRILIIDDNRDILLALNLVLEPHVEQVKVTAHPEKIEEYMRAFAPDVVLLDMNFSRDSISGCEGFHWLEKIRKIDPDAVVIFITAYADTDKAVQAIKAGATDFIPKPWEREKLLATVISGVEMRRNRMEVKDLREQLTFLSQDGEGGIIGRSEGMQRVFDMIDKLRDTTANILITGENGTGKDLVAHALHRNSPRADKIFTAVDLGSIPEQLFESELFGFEKGAFTDARRDKPGRMEIARGGTLFLDEIGNLSLQMQMKLLTAIEKCQIVRLGATRPTDIDVRLISATNANLEEMVAAGKFRQDLLYRINTIEIALPPLRERGDDIILLADHFLERFSRKYGKQHFRGLSGQVRTKLLRYPWPGNVRELEHAVERAVILAGGTALAPEDFMLTPPTRPRKEELNLEKLEREAVETALRQAGSNIGRAAELLGITRYALRRKMDKGGI